MEKYTQVKVLGKGSFGSAWLIQRNCDKEQFVAKEVRLAGLKPAEKESAKHEISMLRTLNHPNITQYVDHFEHKGSLFIVMEYANGGDLYTKIKNQKGNLFSEVEILCLFSQICLALGYLHDRRILHRDLKTQNVFLTRDGIVKLGDFGISTVLRNTYELKRTVCGTPYYFSPELCLNKPYNNKSDVWALGCVLYEMATLNHAFDGNNMKALVQKILKGVYPPIHAGYSTNLSKLIEVMLQIDPHRRPNVAQIIELPFIRDALVHFQKELQLANKDKRSVVPEDVQKRMKEEAAERLEEYKEREKAGAAKLAAQRQKQKNLLDQRQRENEERRRMLLEKHKEAQQKHDELVQQRRAEIEQRVKEQRKLQEKNQKVQQAANKQREQEWDQNMLRQAEENRARREEDARRRNVATPPKVSTPTKATGNAAAAEMYKEMRRQAAVNKKRVQAEMGVGTPPSPNTPKTPHQPPPPRAPPTSDHYSTKKLSQAELDEARRQAFWQMRKEAEKNKRRVLGIDTGNDDAEQEPSEERPSAREENEETPSGTPIDAAAAASPLEADGEEGFHAFLNGEAVVGDEKEDAIRRAGEYGALDTAITVALGTTVKRAPDDFQDDAPATDPTQFLLDGKALELPNVSASDPLTCRIESLRMFLEDKLGDDTFIQCYKTMNDISADNDQAMEKLNQSLTEDQRRFIPLIAQLLVCEDAFNKQSLVGR